MKKWFLTIIALQVVFILGLAGTTYAMDWLGKEIRLATVPVDPRDVLYGDYVTLSYEMNRLEPSLWKGDADLPARGDKIYMVLRPNTDGLYEPIAAYSVRVAVNDTEVMVKGVVDYRWDDSLSVRYGLERYYVPKGTGRAMEDQADNPVVTMKIAPWGQLVITDVDVHKKINVLSYHILRRLAI
jgi:uncharacterized membrane-anchored protein